MLRSARVQTFLTACARAKYTEPPVFRDKLQRIVESCDGALAALLMGFDGIAVESFVKQNDPDLNTVGMEFSYLLAQVKKAAETLGLGDVEEVTIRTGKVTLALYMLSSEYFVAMAIASDGNLGKARYLLRVMAPQLRQEI